MNMKRVTSLFLVLIMVLSLCPMALAAGHETLVSYEAQGVSEYLLTVPAKLAPGALGTVKLEGTWPTNETINVTADKDVTLTNNIDNSTKVLGITFAGISQAGDNTQAISVSKSISVADIENALFGVWSGEFFYNLSVEDDGSGGSDSTPSVEYAATFADNSWSEIIDAVQNDAVPSTWSVGDTKTMTINSVDYNVQIIGKDHDTYTSGGTAPLTFQLVELYGEKAQMNAANDNTTGWSGSEMRTTTLPAPAILANMPSEVQGAIKAVDKQTLKGDKTGLETTSDKLFLLSEIEVLGSTTYSNGNAEGSEYVYYADGGSTVKTFEGSAAYWWLRGPSYYNSDTFSGVSSSGSLSSNIAYDYSGVAFGFCF